MRPALLALGLLLAGVACADAPAAGDPGSDAGAGSIDS